MADFTPTLGDYTELKPFRFWCQKVLPLVYDDSLSYYELLCKVVDYLNKTMEDVDTMHDDVVNLHSAYVQLQDYVNTYFDNLDVQEEINNKLDDMAEDGSLTSLLLPLVQMYAVPEFVDSTAGMTDTKKIYVLKSSGHVWAYNGTAFYDTTIPYVGDASNLLYNYTNIRGNLNDITGNGRYWYNSDDVTNSPENGIFVMLSVVNSSLKYQVLFGASSATQGHIWTRRNINGTWFNWERSDYGAPPVMTAGHVYEADLNNITANGIYTIPYPYDTNVDHTPPADGSYVVESYVFSNLIFHKATGFTSGNRNQVYIRYSVNTGSTWSDWAKINTTPAEFATAIRNYDILPVTSLDSVPSVGWYWYNSVDVSDSPEAGIFFLFNIVDTNIKYQILFGASGATQGHIWTRRNIGNNWFSWTRSDYGAPPVMTAGHVYESDLNSITANGIYTIPYPYGSNVAHTPPADGSYIIEAFVFNNMVFQRAYGFTSTNKGQVYTRYSLNNGATWNDWSRSDNDTLKKIAFFGDSITWGTNGTGGGQVSKPFPSIVADLLKQPCYNYGQGGMGWCSTQYYPQIAYDVISTTDLTGFDCAVLCFGVNDSDKSIGAYDTTDETTIMGQVNKCLNYLGTNYPALRVIMIAPFNGRSAGSFPSYNYGWTRPAGWTRQDLSDAIKRRCEELFIPYLEQKRGPINSYSITTLLGTDSVHPTQTGYYKIAAWIAGEIDALMK